MKQKSTINYFLILVLAAFFHQQILAQPQPTLPRINLEEYVSGFDSITDIVNANDARLFIVEQRGKIWIVDGSGNTLATPFLDITHLLQLDHNERGLLGMTFDPDYANNGYFYVNYTAAPTGETHISRFQVSGDPNIANPASETVILTQSQPFGNHNAGDLNFGPDGYLYIPLGDGGSAGDPLEAAQDGSTWLGKVLRIDVSTLPYTIPPDNPFINDPAVLDEIWAIGVRNPWRSSFDRATGDFWIGDVGQNLFEEINFEPASSSGGMNWGWDCFEGFQVFETAGCGPASQYDFPEFAYGITGDHCAVQGGFVYRGSDFPVMQGHYVFADFCSGQFWTLYPDGAGGFNHTTQLKFDPFNYTTFGEDAAGELYVGGRGGTVYRVTDIACQNNKIQICHKAGNKERTLCIAFDQQAIDDHLAHGDELGPCGGSFKWSGEVTESQVYVSIAPNPFDGVATVEIALEADANVVVEVYDLKGSKVMDIHRGAIKGGAPAFFEISAENLAGGAYILKVTGDSFSENYKLIISK